MKHFFIVAAVSGWCTLNYSFCHSWTFYMSPHSIDYLWILQLGAQGQCIVTMIIDQVARKFCRVMTSWWWLNMLHASRLKPIMAGIWMLRQGMDSGTAIVRSTANKKPLIGTIDQSEALSVAHDKCDMIAPWHNGVHRCDDMRLLLFKFTENKLENAFFWFTFSFLGKVIMYNKRFYQRRLMGAKRALIVIWINFI